MVDVARRVEALERVAGRLEAIVAAPGAFDGGLPILSPTPSAWTAKERLGDLSLHADWDSVASMIEALRIYLFDHGTVPTWNFFFCGGRPELAVPYSWAFTWPSLFAYAFPPNQAIVAVWMAMSVVGFAATRALFLRWTGSRLGAFFGAGLYVSSGMFVKAFQFGHVSWAFYHLVPVLMLLFERTLEGGWSRARRNLSWLTVASFCFFTSGLPHALIHFYPALLLLVALRLVSSVASGRSNPAIGLGFASVGAHLIGLVLAMYKLWPAVAWQVAHPRPGVWNATQSLGRVFRITVTWNTSEPFFANLFLGPVAWLIAAYVLSELVRRFVSRRSNRAGSTPLSAGPTPLILGFLLPLVGAGLMLALGTGDPSYPGYWLQRLPLFDGVRVFARFLVLTVFGLSGFVAFGLAWIAAGGGVARWRPGLAVVAGLSVLGPVLVHGGLRLRAMPAIPLREIQDSYAVLGSPTPPEMLVLRPRVFRGFGRPGRPGHASAALRGGYWIANCRSDLALPHVFLPEPRSVKNLAPETGWTLAPAGVPIPLSDPPPHRIRRIGHDRIVLEYAPDFRGAVDLNLSVMETFRFNAEPSWRGPGLVRFEEGGLDRGRIVMQARYGGPREGLAASLVGLGVAAGFFLWVARRARAETP